VILLELFILNISPLLIDVLLIKIILVWWNEWRLKFLILEVLPREISEPGMRLDLLCSV
jgi:hypothetical protein